MKRLDDLHQSHTQDRSAQQEKYKLNLAQLNSCTEDTEAILKRNFNAEILQSKPAISQPCENLLRGENYKAIKRPPITFMKNEETCQQVSQVAPWHISAESYTNPSRSVADGKGLREAMASSMTQFTVSTKDSEGMPSYCEKDQITVHIQTASGQDVANQITNKKNGAYTVTYQPPGYFWPEGLRIKVHVNGQPLHPDPWHVEISPCFSLILMAACFVGLMAIIVAICTQKRDQVTYVPPPKRFWWS